MKALLGIIVAVIVIGGGYWYWQSTQAPAMMTDTAETSQQPSTSDTTGAAAPMIATVTFNGDAFSPSTVSIAKGGTVTFTSTGGNMWVASNAHPQHTGYSGTTRTQHCPDTSGTVFDQCAPGTSFSMTFQKAGTWGYHDHLNASLGGTVLVQ